MSKPLMVVKRSGPDWTIWYTDNDEDERLSMSVYGSPTIDDALQEAHLSLDATQQGWYTITKIELDPPVADPNT